MVGCLTQGNSNASTKFGETPAFRRSIQCRAVKWDTLLVLAEQEKCLYASALLAGVTLACSLEFQIPIRNIWWGLSNMELRSCLFLSRYFENHLMYRKNKNSISVTFGQMSRFCVQTEIVRGASGKGLLIDGPPCQRALLLLWIHSSDLLVKLDDLSV